MATVGGKLRDSPFRALPARVRLSDRDDHAGGINVSHDSDTISTGTNGGGSSPVVARGILATRVAPPLAALSARCPQCHRSVGVAWRRTNVDGGHGSTVRQKRAGGPGRGLSLAPLRTAWRRGRQDGARQPCTRSPPTRSVIRL